MKVSRYETLSFIYSLLSNFIIINPITKLNTNRHNPAILNVLLNLKNINDKIRAINIIIPSIIDNLLFTC